MKSHYVDSKLEGKTIIYLENGEVNTNKNIEFVEYHENGNIEGKANFVDGEEHGWCYYYNEERKAIRKTRYENGVEKETVYLF